VDKKEELLMIYTLFKMILMGVELAEAIYGNK
jgi:hypothetical protein